MSHNTSTEDIIKCPICSSIMSKEKKQYVQNYFYKCYKCKITIDLINALIDTEKNLK